MWWTTRAAATAAVLGAALVTAAVHNGTGHNGTGHNGTGHGHGSAPATVLTATGLPAALSAPQAYQPPKVTLPAPAAHVRVLPRAATRPAVRATPRTTHATPRPPSAHPATTKAKAKPRPVQHHVAPTTSYSSALNNVVARIPTYRAGTVRWVVSRAYAFWGTADWYHGVLYVSPDVPRNKLYDVAVHEWSHELSVLDYSGDVAAATRAMNAWFGGSDLVGAERAADCMSILQGATWTHYTTCTNAHWRWGARLLVAGQRL
jgi:hypothetical protein